MTHDRTDPDSNLVPGAPRPEDGAHADEVGAEADALRDLARLWQSAPPPEPSAETWAATLRRIERALPSPSGAGQPRRSRFWPLLTLAVAATLACVLLARSLWAPVPPAASDDEPFPVLSTGEVTIISMDARDTDALVVGHPPVADPFEFATPADVTVVKVQPYEPDGPLPELRGGEVPMLVAPGALPADDR
jgi:hypothetical protein